MKIRKSARVDQSRPTYPEDSWRPSIQNSLSEFNRPILSPFFCFEFLYRYKELFKFILSFDPEFQKDPKVKNYLLNNNLDDGTKDIIGGLIFDFYVDDPYKLLRAIKHFRKQQTNKTLIDVDSFVKKQCTGKPSKGDFEERRARAEQARFVVKPPREKPVVKANEEEQSPGALEMAGNFASAMKDFALSGFLKVTSEQYKHRMDICNACEFWKAEARMGLGKCLKCGCTGAKQWIATSVCPINKWGAISREEVEASKEKENVQTEEAQGPVSQQADGSPQESSS